MKVWIEGDNHRSRADPATTFSIGAGAWADPTPAEEDPRAEAARARRANDNWGSAGNASEVAAAVTQVGAFPLGNGSRDAALLVSLAAGSYTASVSGVGAATGTALVEMYVVP